MADDIDNEEKLKQSGNDIALANQAHITASANPPAPENKQPENSLQEQLNKDLAASKKEAQSIENIIKTSKKLHNNNENISSNIVRIESLTAQINAASDPQEKAKLVKEIAYLKLKNTEITAENTSVIIQSGISPEVIADFQARQTPEKLENAETGQKPEYHSENDMFIYEEEIAKEAMEAKEAERQIRKAKSEQKGDKAIEEGDFVIKFLKNINRGYLKYSAMNEAQIEALGHDVLKKDLITDINSIAKLRAGCAIISEKREQIQEATVELAKEHPLFEAADFSVPNIFEVISKYVEKLQSSHDFNPDTDVKKIISYVEKDKVYEKEQKAYLAEEKAIKKSVDTRMPIALNKAGVRISVAELKDDLALDFKDNPNPALQQRIESFQGVVLAEIEKDAIKATEKEIVAHVENTADQTKDTVDQIKNTVDVENDTKSIAMCQIISKITGKEFDGDIQKFLDENTDLKSNPLLAKRYEQLREKHPEKSPSEAIETLQAKTTDPNLINYNQVKPDAEQKIGSEGNLGTANKEPPETKKLQSDEKVTTRFQFPQQETQRDLADNISMIGSNISKTIKANLLETYSEENTKVNTAQQNKQPNQQPSTREW